MFDLLDQSGDKDLANVRSFDLGNNKIRMTREDPYGFVSISYERGQIPESLKGAYTSFEEARKAVESYLVTAAREYKEPKTSAAK